MAPVEMIMTPHPEPKISNNEILRERSREMQNPCCNIVANTSCDEKALETSTKKSLFDSQDQIRRVECVGLGHWCGAGVKECKPEGLSRDIGRWAD
jgi:hypothetical protein